MIATDVSLPLKVIAILAQPGLLALGNDGDKGAIFKEALILRC